MKRSICLFLGALSLLFIALTPAIAKDYVTFDEMLEIMMHTDQRNAAPESLVMLSSCDLSMEVQNVRCSCSGTDCTSSGSGNNTVLTCTDSEGTTTCSVTNNGQNCSCNTVDKTSIFAFR